MQNFNIQEIYYNATTTEGSSTIVTQGVYQSPAILWVFYQVSIFVIFAIAALFVLNKIKCH
jgi:hypothetical protein